MKPLLIQMATAQRRCCLAEEYIIVDEDTTQSTPVKAPALKPRRGIWIWIGNTLNARQPMSIKHAHELFIGQRGGQKMRICGMHVKRHHTPVYSTGKMNAVYLRF